MPMAAVVCPPKTPPPRLFTPASSSLYDAGLDPRGELRRRHAVVRARRVRTFRACELDTDAGVVRDRRAARRGVPRGDPARVRERPAARGRDLDPRRHLRLLRAGEALALAPLPYRELRGARPARARTQPQRGAHHP